MVRRNIMPNEWLERYLKLYNLPRSVFLQVFLMHLAFCMLCWERQRKTVCPANTTTWGCLTYKLIIWEHMPRRQDAFKTLPPLHRAWNARTCSLWFPLPCNPVHYMDYEKVYHKDHLNHWCCPYFLYTHRAWDGKWCSWYNLKCCYKTAFNVNVLFLHRLGLTTSSQALTCKLHPGIVPLSDVRIGQQDNFHLGKKCFRFVSFLLAFFCIL